MPRYINIDGYRKLFDEEYKETKKLIEQGETHLDNLAEGFHEASQVIDRIPTADVQEVRHGRWIEDNETGCLMCSECGHVTDEIIGDMIEQDGKIIHRSMNPFYCSKCGAKMDGRSKQ